MTWWQAPGFFQMEMNFMGNIIPPFLQTRRFSLIYSAISPNYHFKLEIASELNVVINIMDI